MRAVRSSDTKIEILLRHNLRSRGYRYRKNYKELIGKPDIVFLKQRLAIFCDSEFWHGKDWDVKKYAIKSNREFWHPKIERNIQRDKEVSARLSEEGWIVLRFWGKEIMNNLEDCVNKIEEYLNEKK